jgi:D-3-phosphoglycerate dehydrogenase
MPLKIAIGPSSFSSTDRSPLELLERAGAQIRLNPVNHRLTEDEIIDHLEDIDGLIAGLEPLNRKVLKSSPKLKAIARVGIGMDSIDIEAARDLGIKVSNTPDAPTDAVAEMCLTALLSLGRELVQFNTDMHNGKWEKRIGFSIMGTIILFIGYGRIGRRFAEILHPFNPEILVYDPNIQSSSLIRGERLVSLEEGIAKARIISLHASGSNIILDEAAFGKMRKGMVLLNSARGELINDVALVRALTNGVVSSAWLDVFRTEPYSGPLTDFPQVLLTPHISTYTSQCRRQMEEEAARNLLRDLEIDSQV